VRELAALDWAIVGGYLVLAVTAGVLVSRRAGRSVEDYFVAGRNLPWWWLGTSMVATTFAADTPLVVSGMVANHGIAGNWFWWSWGIAHVTMAVFYAALWRRAHVVTDAELLELRYAGRPATVLRGFKAVFFAIVINGIVLGWVIRAMSKISAPFVHWETWLGAGLFARLQAVWPGWLLFGTLDDTLTVLVLFGLITLYSSLGGIRGVILTDLFQFVLAIVASIAFAVLAVNAVGGMDGLLEGLGRHYPDAHEILAFVPRSGSAWLPVQVFLIYLAIQWWAQYFADGSGYLAQRLSTARTDEHAEGGALWFCVANYGLRTWPWVLIGLVGLVMYPLLGAAGGGGLGADIVAADREMAYPVLMAAVLPAGLLGLTFASLLAAFMSTVDTHINWGASYMVNDIYQRFIRPQASERELVMTSRLTVVGIAVLAILVASQISSVEKAWKLFVALGAGLGLPSMLRWVWWRVNAYTEIVGMITAVAAAVVLYLAFPGARDEYILVGIVGVAMPAALLATFVTKPVPAEHLRTFVRRVQPPGWWGRFAEPGRRAGWWWLAVGWVLGNLSMFGLTFGTGYALFGHLFWGAWLLALGGLGAWLTLWCTRRSRAHLPQ
jgi:solute:Na+ symporter, SSS family